MDSLTVSVPTEQQAAVDSWQDGETYNLVVKQTGAGTFDLVSSGEPEGADDAAAAGEEPDMSKSENPAIAIVMAKKGK